MRTSLALWPPGIYSYGWAALEIMIICQYAQILSFYQVKESLNWLSKSGKGTRKTVRKNESRLAAKGKQKSKAKDNGI